MSRDALIFFSDFDDTEVWKKTLLSELPDLDFRADPSAGDPADVRYALVWKPPSGFFARFPQSRAGDQSRSGCGLAGRPQRSAGCADLALVG